MGDLSHQEKSWHTLEPAQVFEALGTSPDGLSAAEAQARLQRFGPNELPRERAPSRLQIFLRQFKSPLIYILLLAAALAVIVGDLSDAGFIGVVLLLNALIGGWQEWRAEQSSRALQQMLRVRAAVLRDGETREIDAERLVPGDIVSFESGGRVPADVRLLAARGLQIDESLLTGESLAVTKRADRLEAESAPLAERQNMALAGSIVARGRGEGVVVATGSITAVGRIAVDVISAAGGRTPLMERMERFSRTVAVVILIAAILVGVVGIAIHHYGLGEMVMYGIALAVAAIPEGLPITITIALAIATTRMARRGVIVRRLAAVEGLGSCTFVASDKTGTLTCNELTVREVLLASGQRLQVTGQGFAPQGQALLDGAPADPARLSDLSLLLRAAVLCNEGGLHRRDGKWTWHGDPTDVALLSLGHKLGADRDRLIEDLPQINEVPFEAERRFAATYHRGGGGVEVYVKGAPEQVLDMCELRGRRDALLEAAQAMAEQGYRVLALASGAGPADLDEAAVPPAPSGLTLAGLVGMIDPLRPGVREAVAACHRAGVTVCMVTGDHPVTALAIARDLGLDVTREQVVTGAELERLPPERVPEAVRAARVFARVAPHQKLQIVEAARGLGHYVAVTGDGVNDAPALRAAHIGVAMGRGGTDVARESAELVLSDDNFASIVAGVEEGRIAYDNIRKVIFLLVSTGAAEVLLLGLAVAVGAPLPLLPVQILWLNLVTSGVQDKPLAFEHAEEDVLRRPPRPPEEPVFNRLMIERVAVTAVVMAALGFGAFLWFLRDGWSHEEARNGLLLFLVLMKTFHLGSARSETRYSLLLSPWRSPLLIGAAVLAVLIQVLAMYTPPLQAVLSTRPVPATTFFALLGLALLLFAALELHKWTWRTGDGVSKATVVVDQGRGCERLRK